MNSRLKNLESGRRNSAGPVFCPMVKPTWSPMTAAAKHPTRMAARFNLPWLARIPAVNRRESPGRKKPTSRPVSAKMMSINPISPYGLRSLRIVFGSRLSARMVESRCTTAQDRRSGPTPPGTTRSRQPPLATPLSGADTPTVPPRRPHWTATPTKDQQDSLVAKPLVIVESKAKAETIAGFLGRDLYTVMPSVGHIRDLPQGAKQAPKSVTKPQVRRLGIDVDDHFRPVYVVPDNKKHVVADLKAALKGASELYLATDEDREGEAISWHLLEVLKPKVPVKRMVFHEITNEAIADAIENWRDLDMKLVEAQEGRRILDRLVGYEVSNVAFRRIGRGTSVGRVQSVATRLVVDRERARMAFRNGTYWDIEGTFDADAQSFPATLVQLDGKRLALGRDFDAVS